MVLYNWSIASYKGLVGIAALKNKKAKLLTDGQKTVFRYLEQNIDKNASYVWFHASSLGEFEQGRPLMEALKAQSDKHKIILTFFSPSGYEVRKNYAGADLVCYLPFDIKKNAVRFLDLVNPEIAVFIKYEFWANYLFQLRQRHIPTYIVSSIFRPSQQFFKWYGSLFRKMLKCFTHLFVQDERSRELLSSIGIENVTVCGDTRFDRVLDIRAQAKNPELVEMFVENSPKTLVVGSSWPEDEAFLIDYFNQNKELKLIIAPHEIHESHLADIESKLKRPSVRYSKAELTTVQQADCLIMDCFGLLSSIYRYGQIAYIGGGFGAGIHNVTEAAVYGIPVIFGPKYDKFKEAKELIALKGGFSINNGKEFSTLMTSFLSDENTRSVAGKTAGDYILTHSGAAKVIMKHIFGL